MMPTKPKVTIKRLVLPFFVTMVLLHYNLCSAANSSTINRDNTLSSVINPDSTSSSTITRDSTYINTKSFNPAANPTRDFFLLDSGVKGPNRPAAGESYWNGGAAEATTSKRCPSGYAPSVGLAYQASEQGGGAFYGTVVLSASFNTTTYNLYNIAAYTVKDTRNGYLTFKWEVYCTKT